MRDPRTGRYLASVTSWFYGPKIWVTDDPTGEWEQAEGTTLPEGDEKALERIWVIAPGEADGLLYAGGDPGVRCSRAATAASRGRSTAASGTTRRAPTGTPATAASASTPSRPGRATRRGSSSRSPRSASGSPTTGARPGGTPTTGIVPDYVPEETRDQNPIQHCVHDVRRAPGRPERLFMQFHGGVYRSDDGGGNWIDIGEGLPSDFGFPIVVDPADADSAYVIPLIGAEDRTPPDGAVRVWETRDAGASWQARGDGLPERAYLTILREAFDNSGEGEGLELYFGATSGEVFGSRDAGASWTQVADHLAPVYSVRTA